jgi:hypothetical protein
VQFEFYAGPNHIQSQLKAGSRGGFRRLADTSALVVKAALHWSFQPPRDHPIPVVNDADWPLNAVDMFVLARIEKAALSPALRADKTGSTWRPHQYIQ